MGISPLAFYNTLVRNNIDFFTGVPDSLLRNFCSCIDDNVPEGTHIIAANEGNAISLAAGYHMGTGKLPLVYLQNSGFGNAINPLLSLCDPEVYSIPMLVIIGWRGEPGLPDEPQHIKQGKVQIGLLEAMDYPYETISKGEEDFEAKVKKGIDKALDENRPFILLVKKGSFDTYESCKTRLDEGSMTREESLEKILNQLGHDDIVVSTTGRTSREIFELREKNGEPHFRDFLTVGSMGHCSSIALGVAIAKPHRKVICIDGDGAMIMHLGSLSTIGKMKPRNFFHVLINNRVHESVGSQETSSKFIDIQSLVKSNGYRTVFSEKKGLPIENQFRNFLRSVGPAFFEIVVKPGARVDLGRPTENPIENKRAFMNFVKK